VAALLVLLGVVGVNDPVWLWAAPIISGAFLAITGGLLLWDLEHPERFYLIFTKPQWRSWLVKGAFIIAGYSLVLLLHFVASLAGSTSWQSWLMVLGIPLSVLTAVYTAYLFAQAKARDMWQNPLLPPHLFVQAMLLGSAVLLLGFKAGITQIGILATTGVMHILMIWGEVSLTHPTAHARLAIYEMVHGRYRSDFWIGMLLSLLGAVVPSLALLNVVSLSFGAAGAPLALIGLMLFENAYVQAGQSVPLA
jgi:Ni/Fe-hydrogenase subunit HybB-like protein